MSTTTQRNPLKMRSVALKNEIAIISEKIERGTATKEDQERLIELRQAGFTRGIYYTT